MLYFICSVLKRKTGVELEKRTTAEVFFISLTPRRVRSRQILTKLGVRKAIQTECNEFELSVVTEDSESVSGFT